MDIVYVLYFNEWGWEEGEDNSGQILGVFTDKAVADTYEKEAEKHNKHGQYNVIKVKVNEFAKFGWY